MENPIKKWMIWGYHYFLERSVWFVWFVWFVCLVCLFGLFVCLVCLVWFGLVWFGLVWCGLVCFGLFCFVCLFCFVLFCFVLVWFGLFVCLFPKIGVSQNGWFIMENPIKKWMIWGYHYFLERSVWLVWFVCLVCLFVCLFVWFVWFGLFGLVWCGLVWFGLFCFVCFVLVGLVGLVCLFVRKKSIHKKNTSPETGGSPRVGPRSHGRLRHEMFDERLEAAFVPAGPGGLLQKRCFFSFLCCLWWLPSRGLTYPTLGSSENHRLKMPFLGDMLVPWRVVSTHLKNISQIGSFPQIGVKIKHIWNHHPVSFCCELMGIYCWEFCRWMIFCWLFSRNIS